MNCAVTTIKMSSSLHDLFNTPMARTVAFFMHSSMRLCSGRVVFHYATPCTYIPLISAIEGSKETITSAQTTTALTH